MRKVKKEKMYSRSYLIGVVQRTERHAREEGFREGLAEGRKQLAAEFRKLIIDPSADPGEEWL